MIALAALLVGVACWLLMPVDASPRLGRLFGSRGISPGRGGVFGGLATLRPGSRRRQSATARRAGIVALAALVAELHAGRPPSQALAAVDGAERVWPAALAAVRMDADVAEALRIDGEHLPVARSLAACWEVSAHTGAGLTAAVDRLAEAARAAEEVRGQLAAQLAGPRATARTLALLPVLGIAMGQVAGVDPLGWLLTSPAGLLCLLAGAVLDLVGLLWTQRIAARVEAEL